MCMEILTFDFKQVFFISVVHFYLLPIFRLLWKHTHSLSRLHTHTHARSYTHKSTLICTHFQLKVVSDFYLFLILSFLSILGLSTFFALITLDVHCTLMLRANLTSTQNLCVKKAIL